MRGEGSKTCGEEMCSSAIQQSRLGQPRHDAPDAWISLAGLGRAVTSQGLRASCRKQMQSIELVANAGALRQTNMIQRVRLPFRSVMVQHLICPYPCLYVDALGKAVAFRTQRSPQQTICAGSPSMLAYPIGLLDSHTFCFLSGVVSSLG